MKRQDAQETNKKVADPVGMVRNAPGKARRAGNAPRKERENFRSFLWARARRVIRPRLNSRRSSNAEEN